VLAGVCVAAAFTLYFWGAGRSFAYDEANTVGTFVRPGDLLRPFTTQAVFNNHPLFSFLSTLIGLVTSTDEPWMRLLPALLGATTVGLFAGWAARRYGWTAALAGAAVLATTPVFVGEVRQARGYAIVALCALVASIVLVDGLRSRAARAAYVAAIAAGVATHLYMLLVVLAHAGYVLARRPLDVRRLVQMAGGVALGGLAYVGLWRTMIDASEERGSRYRPTFVEDAARGLLAGRGVAMVALAAILAVAAWHLGRRLDVTAAILGPAAAIVVVWQVQRPTDLYVRFLIAAALPIAAAVAWVVHRHRWVLPIALAVSVGALVSQLDELREEPPVRRAAQYVAGARALGLRPCAMGYPAIGAYTDAPPRYTHISQVPDCDVVVQVNVFGDGRMAALKAVYPYDWVFLEQRIVSAVPREALEAAFREHGFDAAVPPER
jgi:hypothetical protein